MSNEEWDKVMAEIRQNNAVLINRRIQKKIEVNYVPTEDKFVRDKWSKEVRLTWLHF